MDVTLTMMQVTALTAAGMCHALLGSIKVPLAARLNIDEGKVGGLVSVFGFTLIPMAFAAGIFADSLGKQFVVVCGCLLLIASVVVLAHVRTYLMALISVLLLGTGWSAMVNVLNALQGPAFLPLKEDAPLSFAMNLGDFVFGCGAFVMPIAIAWSLRRFNVKGTFLAFAAMMVIPLLLSLGVDWEGLQTGSSQMVENAFQILLADQVVVICCIAFFFHVPIEATVATWTTTLLKDQGLADKTTSLMLSLFWLTFTVSRLAAALLIPAGSDHAIAFVMAICCIGFSLGLVLSQSGRLTAALVIVAGAILGPLFPILIALLVGHVLETNASLQGRAIGLFFCIGGIGWATVPLIVGQIAKKTSSVQKGFIVVVGCAVCLSVLCYILMHFNV